jgi:hypothetical protein
MNIVKAQKKDFVEVWYLLEVLGHQMLKDEWHIRGLYFDEVRQCVDNGFAWICRQESGIALGVILFSENHPAGDQIASGNKKTLYVRCMAVHEQGRKNGAVKELFSFIENFAHSQGFASICFDAFSKNQLAITDLSSENYKQKGDFLLNTQKIPFYYFEKDLAQK